MADKTEIIYDLIFNTEAAVKDVASLNVQLKTVQENMKKTTAAGSAAAASLTNTSRAFGNAGQSVQNASFQVSDFATQITGGVDASRALAQQLPQLLGGFGALGAGIGAAVAILVPLGQSLAKTRDYAKELADGVEKLEEAQSTSRATIVDLTEEYGRYATTLRDVAKTQEELARQEITKALVDQSTAILEMNAAYVGTAGAFGEVANQLRNLDFGRSAIAQLFNPLDEASTKVNFLKDKFSLTEEAARGVIGPFTDFQVALKNTNAEAAALALQQFNDWLVKNKDDATSAIPIFNEMNKQFEALFKSQAKASMAGSTSASSGFSFTPFTSANGFNNYEGNAAVAAQLAAIEQRVADAKKASADAAREAAAAQREQAAAYEQFINSIERGVTPLQRTQDTLRKAEENFARFREQMSPEEVAAYSVYIEDLNTKIADLTFKDRWDQMAQGITAAKDAMTPLQEAIQSVGQSIQDSLVNGLSDSFMSFIEGTKSAEEAFKEFAATFLKEITAMIIKALFLYAIQAALGGVPSTGLGGLLGGTGGFYAKGGVFNRGRELQKFANGGIVNSPTLFPMSTGTGLMGEAGPEAIVPLTRRNGKLGVEASPVNVTVINNSSASVSTSRSADGGLMIAVEEALASAITRGGTKIDRAMASGYGLRRAGR